MVSSLTLRDCTAEAAATGGELENSEETIRSMPSENSLTVPALRNAAMPSSIFLSSLITGGQPGAHSDRTFQEVATKA